MAQAKLSFAIARRYDTKFLLDRVVEVRDHEIEFHEVGPAPWPAFSDMVNELSYDIAEQAMSHYVIAKDYGKPLTAIPVFPSRFFPQMGFNVNREAGIFGPKDLEGKRIGVSGFGFNPAAWMRGILAHQYGVEVEKIIWVEDEDDPFFSGLPYPRAPRFKIERAKDLPRSLEEGTIDGLIGPGGGRGANDRIKRLFDDPDGEIEAYTKATSVFPINTVMTMKEEVTKSHPELANRLMEAFVEARRLYDEEVRAGGETDHMGIDVAVLKRLGLFPDRYGLAPNRMAVSLMVQYCYEQGLIQKVHEPEALFLQTSE